MFRDSQLGSSLFDGEIAGLLSGQLARATSFFSPSLVRSYAPEMKLVLEGALFGFSFLGKDEPRVSPGQRLQNVCYEGATKRRLLVLGLLNVVLPYAASKFRSHQLEHRWSEADDWRQTAERRFGQLEAAVKVATVVNFLLFLFRGRYPSLSDRIAGLKLRLLEPELRGRSVAFDFMNRQLVWKGLTDFLLFFAPLISLSRLQIAFRTSNPSLKPNECGICGTIPANLPHGASECRHKSCYFCIAQKIEEAQGSFPCPKCGQSVTKENLVPLL